MTDLAHPPIQDEAPARFSVEEFMQLVNSDALDGAGKLELVDGVIVRVSPASSTHMRLQRSIFRSLDQIFGDGLGGRIAQFELSLRLGEATLRDADVGVLKIFEPGNDFPDLATVLLVVEIAQTTLEKDLNAKRLDYAGAAIPHYWVVDAVGRRVHVMSMPLNGDYAERRLFAFGDLIPVPETERAIAIA
jgi:Uma2 family endonuclease